MFILDDYPKNLDSRYALYVNNVYKYDSEFPNELLEIIEVFEYNPEDSVIVYQKYLNGAWVYLRTVEYSLWTQLEYLSKWVQSLLVRITYYVSNNADAENYYRLRYLQMLDDEWKLVSLYLALGINI